MIYLTRRGKSATVTRRRERAVVNAGFVCCWLLTPGSGRNVSGTMTRRRFQSTSDSTIVRDGLLASDAGRQRMRCARCRSAGRASGVSRENQRLRQKRAARWTLLYAAARMSASKQVALEHAGLLPDQHKPIHRRVSKMSFPAGCAPTICPTGFGAAPRCMDRQQRECTGATGESGPGEEAVRVICSDLPHCAIGGRDSDR